MPAAVPAACGRTLTAPAIALGSSRPLPKEMIDLRQEHDDRSPVRRRPLQHDREHDAERSRSRCPTRSWCRCRSAATAATQRNCRPCSRSTSSANQMPYSAEERPIMPDHDMRRAAEEGEERRRAERRGQHIAEEVAGCAQARELARGNACRAPAARSSPRVSGSANTAQASTTRAITRDEHEDRFPAERGIEHAADQRRHHRHHHHHGRDQPDHGGGALAVDRDRG